MSRRLPVAITMLAALLSCAAPPRPVPHAGLEATWGRFLQMPKQRALAVAGDPDGVWAAGMVGGHPSQIEVERAALERCERSRIARGVPGECRLYGINQRIVWLDGDGGTAD